MLVAPQSWPLRVRTFKCCESGPNVVSGARVREEAGDGPRGYQQDDEGGLHSDESLAGRRVQ